MTGAEALARAVARLAQAGVPDAARDARRLLAHALGAGPERLTPALRDPLDPAAAARLDAAIARRCRREPVSHIVGVREFYGRRFEVNSDVLDPRPDTEALVDRALARPFARVLDLGTGSGCLLATLLAERSGASGTGVDLSEAALAVAARNAAALGVAGRAAFAVSDWFAAVEGRFDLIVSNPPYIGAEELPGLAPELLHEPRRALSPGADALAAYRAIIAGTPAHLSPGGRLLVEIGATQRAAVEALFRAAGFEAVMAGRDLGGRDRWVEGAGTNAAIGTATGA